MHKFTDLTNKRFGRLVVVKPLDIKSTESGYRVQIWEALCDCGKTVRVRGHGTTVKTQSCGCLRKERAYDRCTTLNLITDYKKYVLDNVRLNRKGCWLWTGSMYANGYARTGIKYKVHVHKGRAYRLSYLLFVGEFNENLVVCHRCDNPRCVNPNHLFIGTMADNLNDMVIKGRSMQGEKHYKSKLTEEQVIKILRSNELYSKLALQYNVSECTIRDIKLKRSWKHVKH